MFWAPTWRIATVVKAEVTWVKTKNTINVLISITPQGTISFVSEAWGGRTSDKYLTENFGILEELLPGDKVMADRGFTIQDSVMYKQASLVIPAFTKGKSQLDPIDVERRRWIVNVRIHVELLACYGGNIPFYKEHSPYICLNVTPRTQRIVEFL